MPLLLPTLRSIPPNTLISLSPPHPLIKSPTDITKWQHTRSYTDYALFLQRLSHAVLNRYNPYPPAYSPTPAIAAMLNLLSTLDTWIADIPPLNTPQRFGNLAFRTWGTRLQQCADDVLGTLLSNGQFPGTREEKEAVIAHVKPLLLTAFGSFTRMDYGTGHELSFALLLLALSLVRFFLRQEEQERGQGQGHGQEEETQLVLLVFTRYVELTWHLQDTYRLEPAGSHGVWGLDDSSFLGYIFGSAQLRDQTTIPVSAILLPSSSPLPQTNMYFQHINRIHQVKHGPFHEHSSQLHAIATGVASWSKVFEGLCKMYQVEVLGKTVVVQHVPLGGVLEWDCQEEGDASASAGAGPTHSQ